MGEWWPPQYTAHAATFSGLAVEPSVGGRLVASYGAVEHEWGRVTLWEPTAHLAHTFTLAQPSGQESLVRVDVRATRHGTAVRVEHGGWAQRTEGVRARFTDWPLILSRYAFLAEHPDPEK